MLTEDTQGQATPEQAKPERHWHLVHLEEGEPSGSSLVVRGTPKEVVEKIGTALMVCYRQSKKELRKLAVEWVPDSSQLGLAYLRHTRLDSLTDMLDPGLFDHALFKEGTNMDSLVEAVEDTLESLGTVEVTEQVALKVYFCDEQCPELTEAQEAKGRDCSSHDHAFVMPFPLGDGPIDMANLLGNARQGLRELFEEAGIQVAKTEETGDNVAD